jgi:putative phosphoesterase
MPDGDAHWESSEVPVRIVVVGDTHASAFEKLPQEMLEAIREADWVIHVGDYTSKDVLDDLVKLKGKRFRGVYGNADPQAIRNEVPAKDILEVQGKRIGIAHPASGGSDETIEKRIMTEFKNDGVDAILYGHTHDPKIGLLGGIWLISPGKGYLENIRFGSPTSFAIVIVDEEIMGEIRNVNC